MTWSSDLSENQTNFVKIFYVILFCFVHKNFLGNIQIF